MITDEQIIEEAIRLVEDGVSVTFPVNGNSMLPFIIGGRESVIMQLKPELLEVGQVVLAWVEGRRYVVHRVIRIDGDRVTLMGDGNLVGTEHCTIADIKALVTHVVDDKGRRHDLYCFWRRLAVKAWWHLRPVRSYLLAIYSRL